MRAYLLNPPFLPNFARTGRIQGGVNRGGSINYPIFLSYAAGVLEMRGHAIALVDAVARGWVVEDCIAHARAFKPDLIMIDTNFTSVKNDLEVLSTLKAATGARTVMAGPPASQFADLMLSRGADMVIKGDYSLPLGELVDSIGGGGEPEGVAGVYYNEGGSVQGAPRPPVTSAELDGLPFVTEVYRKHLRITDYHLNFTLHPMVQIMGGRGCDNHCTFCSWPQTYTGRPYRPRSLGNLVDELSFVQKHLPQVKEVFIEDDNFTGDQGRAHEFCDMLDLSGIRLRWSCHCRAALEYETMKRMREAGCRSLGVGFETSKDEILEAVRKGTTIESLVRFNEAAKRAGMPVSANFIIGLPGETRETAKDTIRFIKKIRPEYLQVSIATPIPGTEFHRWCRDMGYLLSSDMEDSIDDKGQQRSMISYPWLSNGEIEGLVNRALREYYLSPSFILRSIGAVLKGEAGLVGSVRSALSLMGATRGHPVPLLTGRDARPSTEDGQDLTLPGNGKR